MNILEQIKVYTSKDNFETYLNIEERWFKINEDILDKYEFDAEIPKSFLPSFKNFDVHVMDARKVKNKVVMSYFEPWCDEKYPYYSLYFLRLRNMVEVYIAFEADKYTYGVTPILHKIMKVYVENNKIKIKIFDPEEI